MWRSSQESESVSICTINSKLYWANLGGNEGDETLKIVVTTLGERESQKTVYYSSEIMFQVKEAAAHRRRRRMLHITLMSHRLSDSIFSWLLNAQVWWSDKWLSNLGNPLFSCCTFFACAFSASSFYSAKVDNYEFLLSGTICVPASIGKLSASVCVYDSQ